MGEGWAYAVEDLDRAPEAARTSLAITAYIEIRAEVPLHVDASALGGPYYFLTILALPGQRPSIQSDAPHVMEHAWAVFVRGSTVEFGYSPIGCERRAEFTLRNVSPRTVSIATRLYQTTDFQILTDFPAALGPHETFTGQVRYFPPSVGVPHYGHVFVDTDLDPEPAYIGFKGVGITRTATTPCP